MGLLNSLMEPVPGLLKLHPGSFQLDAGAAHPVAGLKTIQDRDAQAQAELGVVVVAQLVAIGLLFIYCLFNMLENRLIRLGEANGLIGSCLNYIDHVKRRPRIPRTQVGA